MNNIKAINAEKNRHILSVAGNLKLLKKTYNKDAYSIFNNNTGLFWDKINFSYRYSQKNNPIAIDRLKTVIKIIKDKSTGNNSKILDIGFGPADIEMYLSKLLNSHSIYGIDISEKSVKSASDKYPKYKFIIGNILNMPYRNNYFDIVLALEILEHISPSKILIALKEVYRVIKSKGYLIISIPINEGLEDMLLKGINPNNHVRIYTKDLIISELRLGGFKVVHYKQLYAFHNNYFLKNIINKLINIREPNNIIILAQKV